MKGHSNNKQGQSLILIAFAIFTLFAFIGLGVDLGLAYVERVRVQRAADAAALAAASELPLEAAAQLRALEYLAENNFDCGLTVTRFPHQACSGTNEDGESIYYELNDTHFAGPSEEDATKLIRINTWEYRSSPSASDTAVRIQVEVTRKVPIFFMRIFGFEDIPVTAQATAENIQDLDVMLVFDHSGSMEFDTLCYGCWTPDNKDPYPDGDIWPLPWGGPKSGPPTHCSGNDPYERNGYQYIIIEAEEFSRLSNPYDRRYQTMGYTYWVLGRNGNPIPSYLGNAGALGRDNRGAYLAHQPGRSAYGGSDGPGVPCTLDSVDNPIDGIRYCRNDARMQGLGGPFPAPRVDYEFTIPADGSGDQWQIWIRGQGGDRSGNDGDYVFWGITQDYQPGQVGNLIGMGDGFPNRGSSFANGADHKKWEWRLMGDRNGNVNHTSKPVLNSGANYTLHFWAGAPGFDIDRIVITNDPRSTLSSQVQSSSHLDNNRTAWACDPCDARFAGHPNGNGGNNDVPRCTADMAPNPYRYTDAIYDDEQPIRGALEASKKFIRRLDWNFDQIGLVTYGSKADHRTELMCLKWDMQHGQGCTKNRIENTIIQTLDNTHAGGSTNIPHAMKMAIEMLDHRPPHYGRPGAAHVIILMTDGRANTYSDLKSDAPACYQTDYWPRPDTAGTNYERAADCVVYFGLQARNKGIVIFTITLGEGADIELMAYVAELTGGIHRHAPRTEQLDPIFEEFYNRIYLRLVE